MQKKRFLILVGLIKKANYNSKVSEAEGNLPNISSLVKKTNYDTKIGEVQNKVIDHGHDKSITTSEFNKLTAKNVDSRLAQTNLITKTDFRAKLTKLNKKINSSKTKHALFQIELKKLKTIDSSYLKGKNHFQEDGTQNYLVFQPIYKYFKKISNTENISSC